MAANHCDIYWHYWVISSVSIAWTGFLSFNVQECHFKHSPYGYDLIKWKGETYNYNGNDRRTFSSHTFTARFHPPFRSCVPRNCVKRLCFVFLWPVRDASSVEEFLPSVNIQWNWRTSGVPPRQLCLLLLLDCLTAAGQATARPTSQWRRCGSNYASKLWSE